jgi:hypothetical protein
MILFPHVQRWIRSRCAARQRGKSLNPPDFCPLVHRSCVMVYGSSHD